MSQKLNLILIRYLRNDWIKIKMGFGGEAVK